MFFVVSSLRRVILGPFHDMARPRVAVGGDGLQIWREAANVLNKQSPIADKAWSSSLGVGRGDINSKNARLLRYITQGLGICVFLWTRQWTFGLHKRQGLLTSWMTASQGLCSVELVCLLVSYVRVFFVHQGESSVWSVMFFCDCWEQSFRF
jgi:hypothetical protein